ncbi:MAG: hypothetical protein H8E98_05735 [Bacteroidetes bacterium]|nr:hypothetical protein [Bacteroidota bacterium]
MGKLSNKQGQELVEAGVITLEAFEKMQEEGSIGTSRTGRASQPRRVFEGTEISPQVYFKGSKGQEATEEMVACREKLVKVIEKHTVLAS